MCRSLVFCRLGNAVSNPETQTARPSRIWPAAVTGTAVQTRSQSQPPNRSAPCTNRKATARQAQSPTHSTNGPRAFHERARSALKYVSGAGRLQTRPRTIAFVEVCLLAYDNVPAGNDLIAVIVPERLASRTTLHCMHKSRTLVLITSACTGDLRCSLRSSLARNGITPFWWTPS